MKLKGNRFEPGAAGRPVTGGLPPSSSTTSPSAIINGTGMVRPGSGTGVIGGPAKNVAGCNQRVGSRPK